MDRLRYIDIFAGCGGLSLGLHEAGWEGIFAIEKSHDAFATLKYNLIDKRKHFIWEDWLPISEHDINELLEKNTNELIAMQGKVELIVGGPPCQGFSMAGKRNEKDKRNQLVKSYITFIELVKPKMLFFENVHGFTLGFSRDNGKKKSYSNYVINALKKLGYKISSGIVDMSEFGIPQKRKRFIMVGCLNHDPKDFFTKLEVNKKLFLQKRKLQLPVSVQEAISDLEKCHGEVDSIDTPKFKAGLYGEIRSNYQVIMRKGIIDENYRAADSHRFVKHTAKIHELHTDLLVAAPRGKRITPDDNIVPNLHKRGVTVFDPKIPAPTVTSIPDDFLHYNEPRILTVRETARIQSFPDWFQFQGKYTTGGKRRKLETPRYTQVGNAVPPLFAEQVGIALKEMLEDGQQRTKV